MTIGEFQKLVDSWIRTYGIRYFNELTNMAILTEEVGEAARLVSRIYGEQSFKPGEKGSESPEAAKEALADELSDIIWVVACLANQSGIDLDASIARNIEKKTSRDKERHAGNTNINPGGRPEK